MSKFVFLDIDGVLCIKESLEYGGSCALQPLCVERLNQIVAKTGCKIVISSSWRVCRPVDEIQHIFSVHGFAFPESIIDKTPHLSRSIRGHEIEYWMLENGVHKNDIVIIDDDDDMGVNLQERLVLVQYGFYEGGLLDKHVDQAVRLLSTDSQAV